MKWVSCFKTTLWKLFTFIIKGLPIFGFKEWLNFCSPGLKRNWHLVKGFVCLNCVLFCYICWFFFFLGGGGGWHLYTRWWGTATKALILPSGERQNVDVSGHCPPTPCPSPKPILTVTSHLGQSVGLGEGLVGRSPET